MPRAKKKRVTYSHRFICTELSTTASVRLKMVDQKMLGSNGVRQLWILSIWEFIGILLGTNPLGIPWESVGSLRGFGLFVLLPVGPRRGVCNQGVCQCENGSAAWNVSSMMPYDDNLCQMSAT